MGYIARARARGIFCARARARVPRSGKKRGKKEKKEGKKGEKGRKKKEKREKRKKRGKENIDLLEIYFENV